MFANMCNLQLLPKYDRILLSEQIHDPSRDRVLYRLFIHYLGQFSDYAHSVDNFRTTAFL